jgi:SSS family solute:Na+ symporter
MVGGLIAANSSTILTHLNWGASYLVHDFYRRFLKRDATEKHYVKAGRIATVGLFLSASLLVFVLETAKDSFDIILQVGAGTGLLYLVRWFWWRVNAWCEVNAMISSFGVSVLLLVLRRLHLVLKLPGLVLKFPLVLPPHIALIITIAATTIVWLLTARLAKSTDKATLIEFYKKTRPFGPGWKAIRKEAGISDAEAKATHENIPLALVGWTSGVATIWSALFTVGNFLYGRLNYAFILLAVFVVSGLVLIRVINRLWSNNRAKAA